MAVNLQFLTANRAAMRNADLLPGYLARYQNVTAKSTNTVTGLKDQSAITVYGVLTASASNLLAMLFNIPDLNNSAVKQDIFFGRATGDANNNCGLALNTYTNAYSGTGVLPETAAGVRFLFTAVLYNQNPDAFALRINSVQKSLIYYHTGGTGNDAHGKRAFSNTLIVGGDSPGTSLDWLPPGNSITDLIFYAGVDSPTAMGQNESALSALYSIPTPN